MALARCRFAVLVNCSAHPSRIFSDELSSRDQRGCISRPVSCAPTSVASLSSGDLRVNPSTVQRIRRQTLENQRALRFRTIQVCPKDLPATLRQVEYAVGVGGPPQGRKSDARREAARVHHAARRRGCPLPAPPPP